MSGPAWPGATPSAASTGGTVTLTLRPEDCGSNLGPARTPDWEGRAPRALRARAPDPARRARAKAARRARRARRKGR